jgi:hypothetical protein
MAPFLLPLLLHVAPAGAPAVTVVVEGPSVEETKQSLATTTLPVSLRLEPAPSVEVSTPSSSPWPARLAAARSAYVTTNFAECLKQLEGDSAAAELLASGERLLASRVLAWRVACHTGARQPEPARAAATSLAAFQVPLPEDVASMTPEVETLLVRAQSEVGTRPMVKARIESTPSGASVELDGRPVACTTPCSMELLEGAHVVRLSADGYTPTWKLLARTDTPITLEPAAPELAASQWRKRLEKGDALDSAVSLRLLSTSLRAPRLVVLASDPATPKLLRGALAVDGQLLVRAERMGDAEGLMRDLLVRGQVVEEAPSIFARWPFWVAVGLAVAAGVTTGVVLGTRDTQTRIEVGFQ